jgi:RNA polymerase sigma-70 factor (ECF subfamily)
VSTSQDNTIATEVLAPHFFRHEFGRLVSVLVRRFGVANLELCEDAVQNALMRGLVTWRKAGVANEPGAWLYRVAHNDVVDRLRQRQRRESTAEGSQPAQDYQILVEAGASAVYLDHEIKDDQLRMLFVCADPRVPASSQIALALRTLCGFSVDEIALRLFARPETIKKRLVRAHSLLREGAVDDGLSVDTPEFSRMREALPRIWQILYLLFNEGYSSARKDSLIRYELCEEAIRLTKMLAEHPVGALAQTDALLGLMFLHAARLDSRLDSLGNLLVLAQQDRMLWDRELIKIGMDYLQRSARGGQLSRYHIEAALVAEHCFAPNYAATRWDRIVELYDDLDRVAPSPLHALNRAVAIAEWKGAAQALDSLAAVRDAKELGEYYLFDALLGDLHSKVGDHERARMHLQRAFAKAPTQAEKDLLAQRLAALGDVVESSNP